MHAARFILVLGTAAAAAACGGFLGIGDSDIPDPEPADAAADAPLEATTLIDACGSGCADVADGSGCTPPGCPPELLARVGELGKRIVAHDGWLYVLRSGTGATQIVRLRAEPGAALEELDPGAGVTNVVSGNLAVHATGVYWGTANGLRHRNLAAGSTAEDLDPGASVRAVSIDGNMLRFTRYAYEGAGGRLISCTLPGCADESLELANNMQDILVLPSGRVWVAYPKGLQTFSLFDSTGELEADLAIPSWLATDGQLVYFSTVTGLRVMIPASHKVEVVLPTTIQDRVEGVVADGPGVVFFARGKSIYRCALPACNASVLVAATPEPDAGAKAERAMDVAVDAKYVYWITERASVFRAPKP
jgi:hypothetical protein